MYLTITTNLATLSAHPGLAESLQFILVGFFFVTIVLLILAGITSIVGMAFRQPAPKPVAPKPESTAAVQASAENNSVASTTEEPETDEEEARRIAIVVAAAVHSIMGTAAHRIVSIRPIPNDWGREGRRNIFSSHRVR